MTERAPLAPASAAERYGVCRARRCGRRTRAGHLMCYRCWQRVPRPLQKAVNATWQAVREHPSSVAMREYKAAVAAAVDAVAAVSGGEV